MKDIWIKELKAQREGEYGTDYRLAYIRHPDSAFPHRFASAPKHLSSHFNPISKVKRIGIYF